MNPEARYTARDALNHPFFQQYVVAEVRHFSPYRKFKVIENNMSFLNYLATKHTIGNLHFCNESDERMIQWSIDKTSYLDCS